MGFIAYILFAAGMLWLDHRVTSFRIRRALPPVSVKCRACERNVEDPDVYGYELGHGAWACKDCYDKILQEIAMIAWFDNTSPLEGPEEVPKQLEAGVVLPADFEYCCQLCRLYPCGCINPCKPPGDDIDEDGWFIQTKGEHTAVGPYRPLAENFRATGSSTCGQCGYDHPVGSRHPDRWKTAQWRPSATQGVSPNAEFWCSECHEWHRSGECSP